MSNQAVKTADGKAKHHDNVVEISGLTKRYGEFTALSDLNLTVARGRILGLIGPNGAGKTTTIKILVGLAKPSAGTALIDGADCMRDARKIKRLVGYLPDQFGSYDNMRVHEYLDFFGAAYGIRRRQRVKRIAEVLEITASTYMHDRYVATLSHGMQQRIGIARTLLHDPAVLILDEPANGLDPKARVEMRELLLSLAAIGKTLIVTSHILPELSRICDMVAIISHGKLRAAGTLADIMKTVTQTRWVEIHLDKAEGLSAAIPLVEPYALNPDEITISQAECVLRFPTQTAESDWSKLLSSLISAGIGVNQFREIQTDLEDAFLSVTEAADNAQKTSSPARKPGKVAAGEING